MSGLPFYGEFTRTNLVLKANAHRVSLRLFDAEAFVLRKCGSLRIINPQSGIVEVGDAPGVRDEYKRLFVERIRSGRLDGVEQAHLSPDFAVKVLLLPLFVPIQLQRADVRPNHINIKDVAIGDRTLMIRVLPDADQDVVMADANGMPLVA